MLSVYFYLFEQVYFFLPFHKINVKKKCKENPRFQQRNLDQSFLCVHDTICALILFIWGAVLFLYIWCYLLVYSVPSVCVQCNLYALICFNLYAIYVSQVLLKCLRCEESLICVQNCLLEYRVSFPQNTIFVNSI